MKSTRSLRNKSILILGFGTEGMSTYRFLRKTFPTKKLGIADVLPLDVLSDMQKKIIENDVNSEKHFGENYLSVLDSYQIIFRSPGVSLFSPEIKNAQKKGVHITSQTELFLQKFRNQTIGITGTKGKSTTATLVYDILKQGGKNVVLTGNIGKPPLAIIDEILDDTIVVFELSSHQLHGIAVSPHIAIILDIVPDHLDYYPNFEAYVAAKRSIVQFQKAGDYVVYNQNYTISAQIAQQSNGQKMTYPTGLVKNVIATADISLKGQFNRENIKPAIVVGQLYDVPDSVIQNAIKTFKPLPGRLEKVGVHKGIIFYDDALATTPEATVAALDTLGRDVETLLVGGFERKQNFAELAKSIVSSHIKTLILFPTTGKRVWKEVERAAEESKKKKPGHFFVQSMEEAVYTAFIKTHKGKICLSSAASPSFGIFKNYREKSQLFRQHIELQNI